MAITTTAFGLDVESELPLALLEGSVAQPTERSLAVSLRRGVRSTWPQAAQLLCDDRQPDGSLIYEVQSYPEIGYLIAGPSYGTHLLSADGRLLLCDPEGLPDADWQRLLIAQVLPFAAVLQARGLPRERGRRRWRCRCVRRPFAVGQDIGGARALQAGRGLPR
jgi:hypothetical protein